MDTDAYSSYDKQFKLMRLILSYYELSKKALAAGADMNAVFSIPARDKVGRAKHADPKEYDALYNTIAMEMASQLDQAVAAAAGGEE